MGMDHCRRSIIYLGGFSPHKNLGMLVDVFSRIAGQDEFSDVQLIMVGENEAEVFHECFKEVREQVGNLGLSGRVLFTGYLPDEDLVVLLNLRPCWCCLLSSRG